MTKKQKLHILLLFLFGTLIPITVGIGIGGFIWNNIKAVEIIVSSIALVFAMLGYIIINCLIHTMANDFYKENNND